MPSETDMQPRYVPPPSGYVASNPPLPSAPQSYAGAAVTSEHEQPLPATLADALADLQQVSGCGNLHQARHLLVRSETYAHRAAVTAARALAELNSKTTQLRYSSDNQRRAKWARLLVRDMATWRCFGFHASLFDGQRVQDFVFAHVTRAEASSPMPINPFLLTCCVT